MDLKSQWKKFRTSDYEPLFQSSRKYERYNSVYPTPSNLYSRERGPSSEHLTWDYPSFEYQKEKTEQKELLVFKEKHQVHGTFDEWYTHVVKASCVNDPKCQKPPPSMFIKSFKPGVWEKVYQQDPHVLRNTGVEAIEKLRKNKIVSNNNLKAFKSANDNSANFNSFEFSHGDENIMKNNQGTQESVALDVSGTQKTGKVCYNENKKENLPKSIPKTADTVVLENPSKISTQKLDVKQQNPLPDKEVEATLKAASGPEIGDDKIPSHSTETPTTTTATMDNLFKDFTALHYPDSDKRKAFENYVRHLQQRYEKFNQLKDEGVPRKECIDGPDELEGIIRTEQTKIRDLQDDFDVEEYDDELSALKIMPKKLQSFDDNESYEYSKEYGDDSIPTDLNHNSHDNRPFNQPRARVDSFQLYLNRLKSKEKKENVTWQERTENDFNDRDPSLDQDEIDLAPELGDVQDIPTGIQENDEAYHERSAHLDEEKQYNEYADYPNDEFNDFEENCDESGIPEGMQEEELSNEKPIYSEDMEPILIDEISSAVESEDNPEELDELENQPITPTAQDIETEMSSEVSQEEDLDSFNPIDDPAEQSRVSSGIVEDNEGPCEGEEELDTIIPEEESSKKINGVLEHADTLNETQEHFTVPYRHIRKIEPSQNSSYTQYPSSHRQRHRQELDWSKSSNLSTPKISNRFDNSLRRQSLQPQVSTRSHSTGRPLTQQYNQQFSESFYRTPNTFSGYPSPTKPHIGQYWPHWPSYFPSMINLPRQPMPSYSPERMVHPDSLSQAPYFNPWLTPFGNPWMYGFPWWLGFPPSFYNPFFYGALPNAPPYPEMRGPNDQATSNEYGTTGYNWPTKRKTPRMTVYTTVPQNHREYNEKLCTSFDKYIRYVKNVADKKVRELLYDQPPNPTVKR